MVNPRIGIISQARMTSTRLPGKVLLPLAGKSVLQHHVERLQQSNLPIFIATTVNVTDDPINTFARELNLTCYRGDEHHVLSRYYECARQHNLDIIVRVTSDCPLIDGQLIKDAAAEYLGYSNSNLYLSNCLIRTFPRGFDFEIFSFELLEEAYQRATLPAEIEHVTPYINQNRSGRVAFKHVVKEIDKSQYRLTLDTPEDYTLLKILTEEYQAHTLAACEISYLLDAHPELPKINQQVQQKPV